MATSRFWNFGYGSDMGFLDIYVSMPSVISEGLEMGHGELLPLDINHDGWMDLYVITNGAPYPDNTDYPAVVLINNKNGTFSNATATLIAGGIPGNVGEREVITADFNGDGITDIFVADHGLDGDPWPGHLNQLLLGRAEGGFDNATDRLPADMDFTHSAATADIDGDGDLDIFLGNLGYYSYLGEDTGTNPPMLLINDGDANFTGDRTRLPTSVLQWVDPEGGPPSSTSCEFLDADNDGDMDLFLGGDSGSEQTTEGLHRLLLNDGTGHFTVATAAMPLGGFGLSNTITLDVHTMDFDGDGLEDLLLSITSGDPFYYGGRLQALRSTGDGGFADVTSEYFDQQPDTDVPLQWLYIIDINGDGANDIVGDTFYGQVPYINDGTGHYILAPKLSGQYFATYLDIDNDGRVDVFSMQGGESPWVSIQYQRDASVPAIDGTSDDDAILGGLNDQLIKGFAGDDFIFGAIGDDTLQGGAGADALIGGLGSDTADYADRSQSVEITLVAGSKVIAKVNGADEDELTSIENLSGGSAGDKLTGDTGYNVLRGNGGNDTIDGGTGTGDTASFAGGWADYTITESGGVYMIADTVAGRDGTDTVTNIEQFRFNDAALAAASLFNLAPTASNDSGSSGNVLSNDTDANAAIGDTKTVTGIRTGMESAGGSFGAVGALVGKYGTLTIASNGAFSYTGTASDPDTRALLPGQTATEFFTYRVRDAKGLTDTAQLSITVTGSNDAPTIVSNGSGNTAGIQVAENLQLVTTVAATDPDGQSRTYSISGGADAAKFSIDATTGKLSFVAAPDFEQHRDANRDGTYVVTVRAFDGSLSDTQTLSIRVTDVGGNTVNGTSKADKISLSQKIAGKGATNEEDKFDGRAGNDKLDAAGGNDAVKGGSGNDTLNGGLGKDTLTGGDGKDKFVFNTALSSANVDTIGDFKHDTDLIQLDDAIFTKIGSKLESAEFYAAKGAVKAHDKSDRIIYDTKTGKLYFDADGNKKGGVDAVHFATLTKHPLLDHGDFAIV